MYIYIYIELYMITRVFVSIRICNPVQNVVVSSDGNDKVHQNTTDQNTSERFQNFVIYIYIYTCIYISIYTYYMLHTVLHITYHILHMHHISHFTCHTYYLCITYYICIHNNVCNIFFLEVLKQALIPSKRCRPDVATLGTSMAQSGGLQISNQRVEDS